MDPLESGTWALSWDTTVIPYPKNSRIDIIMKSKPGGYQEVPII